MVKIVFIFALISCLAHNNPLVCNAFLFGDQRALNTPMSPIIMRKGKKLPDKKFCCSFLPSGMHRKILKTTIWSNSDDKNNGDIDIDNANDQGLILPGLPPIGFSSYDQNKQSDGDNGCPIGDGSEKTVFVGSDKFELQYTCKVCGTRNSNKVSRIAYRQGVVIAVCKGCKSKHLIADNLGWSNYIGGFHGETNIEKYLEAKGRGDEVNRVTEEVFELEKILNKGDETSPYSEDEGDHFE